MGDGRRRRRRRAGGAADGAATASRVWVPFAQWPGRPVSIAVRARTADAARALVPTLAAVAAPALADEPLDHVRTATDDVRERFRAYRVIAATFGGLALFAVLIAAIGVYGVVAYTAARRTREVGIRVALGASARDVIALFGNQVARLALVGAALGLAGSVAATRVLRGLLFGTDPLDPTVLAGVTVLLAGAAVLAGYVPARRAARIDPTIAMRAE